MTVLEDGREIIALGHREVIRGDVNGDKEINTPDVNMLRANPCSFYTEPCYDPMNDIFGGGFVEPRDASMMRFYVGFAFDYYTDSSEWYYGPHEFVVE